jgi:hypothetical protein
MRALARRHSLNEPSVRKKAFQGERERIVRVADAKGIKKLFC